MRLVTNSGQAFELVGESPYTNKYGHDSMLAVWESVCIDCGVAFQIRINRGIRSVEGSNSFKRRRCHDCISKRRS